ncbi:MAG: hypothetical protein R2770_17730 [Acidimicrobiales bacterium]
MASALVLLIMIGSVVTACGDADNDTSATTQAPTSDPGTEGDGDSASGVQLSGVCPDTIVIQTDWYPSAERGPLFQMLGDDYQISVENKTITGSLIDHNGLDTGVGLEIRSGGPAIGFSPVTSHMYVDQSITMGFTSHDQAAAAYDDAPTLSVVAPFDKNPQIVMWDPQTYPEVETIADLGELGVTINVFPGGPWQEILTREGVVPSGSWDPSFDGTPARFVAAGGEIAQQGFASAEPYEYETLEQWGRPVAFQLVHDTGVQFYSQPLGIRTDDLETLRPCLELFVPMVQQSTVDYITGPNRANAIIIEMIDALDEVIYTADEADWAAGQILELELISNGPDATLGNFDLERVQRGIDQMIEVGIEMPADLTAEQLATNEFIDPSIGLP